MSLLFPLGGYECINCETGGHGRCKDSACDCCGQGHGLEVLQQLGNQAERTVDRFYAAIVEVLK